MSKSNFNTLEDAKKAIKDAYADLVGFCIYEGYEERAFYKAMSMVIDECCHSKNEIEKRIPKC